MLVRTALPVLAVLALAGCGGVTRAADDDRLQVVVGAYPYEFVTERVGGQAVQVENLTEPGAEPHDVELTPQQVGRLGQADVVVRSRGFQPALDDALAQSEADVVEVLDLVETHAADEDGHAHEDGVHTDGEDVDPHVWLDPARLATIADAVAGELAQQSPEHAEGFAQRAAQLRTELEALDADLAAGLASCQRRQLVTSHAAFGYLAEEHGLEQVALSGLSPDAEPSPRRLAEVAELARASGVTTVFFEELVSPRVAEQLAREVDARAAVLSPLEGPPEQGDYLTAMHANLEALRTALGCT
jgi:zinc transport system substrate-binding protein